MWLGRFPNEESTVAYHLPRMRDYHLDLIQGIRALLDHFVPSNGSLHVLDFGIGDGQELSKLGLPVGKITGVDVSPHMIFLAQANLQGFDSELHVGGVEAIGEIPSQSVDLVV